MTINLNSVPHGVVMYDPDRQPAVVSEYEKAQGARTKGFVDPVWLTSRTSFELKFDYLDTTGSKNHLYPMHCFLRKQWVAKSSVFSRT